MRSGSRWGRTGLLGTETLVAHSASTVPSVALNWRTGEIRRDEPYGRRVVPDPDRGGLTGRLCAPLRRQARTPPALEDETPPFLDFQYARPWGVAQVEHSAVLLRCGSRRRIALGPYSRDTVQLAGGRVSGIKKRLAYVRTLRSGAQRRWSLPASEPARMLAHTARRLYLLAGPLGDPPQLYTAPLR